MNLVGGFVVAADDKIAILRIGRIPRLKACDAAERIEPIDVRTSRLTASIFAPRESTRPHSYWIKNLDLLLDVTTTEDFPLMESIQSNLDSGALSEVVYGRNEPPLIHYHRAVDDAIRDA